MRFPNLREEKKIWKKGYKRVASLDEAGRGPIAGPVVAAVVILTDRPNKIDKELQDVNDSKKMSAASREYFYGILTKHPAMEWQVGIVSEKVIDRINIKNASELAMEMAIKKLKKKPDFLIIDGNHIRNYSLKAINHKMIVGGDGTVFSCAAASIIAKVTRDRIMEKYHKQYPQYRFGKHKGYPTKEHLALLARHGLSKIHRRSFAPVKAVAANVPSGGVD